MTTTTCHRCNGEVTRPEGATHWLGICPNCNRSIFEPLQDDEQHLATKDHDQTLHTTRRDYVTETIYPSLGEHFGDYDVDGIAADMLIHHKEIDPRTGLVNDNRSGFVERRDVDFWEVVAAHEFNREDQDDMDSLFDLLDAFTRRLERLENQHDDVVDRVSQIAWMNDEHLKAVDSKLGTLDKGQRALGREWKSLHLDVRSERDERQEDVEQLEEQVRSVAREVREHGSMLRGIVNDQGR